MAVMKKIRSRQEQIILRFRKNKLALFGLIGFLVIVLLAIGVPIFSPYDISMPNLPQRFQPPSLAHPFGTDALGMDMFTKTFAGLRITLVVGILATLIAVVIGIIYGSISGYIAGKTDEFMMALVDILYGLPFIAFVILMVFVFRDYGRLFFAGSSGFFSSSNLYLWEIWIMTLAMGSISWLTIARIVRGEVMGLRNLEFVEAAYALGCSHKRILFIHILPNILGPVIVYATLTAPNVMLFESFISFLGLGIQPPHPSLGRIISDDALARIAATHLNWWLLFFPGLVLAFSLFCLNILGDGLRDALDVK